MRVLIADDEIMVIEMLKRAFSVEGYVSDYALDGLSALNKAISYPYDAIVLDVVMPELNGLELCRELRRRDITTPILFLTSRQELADKVAGLDSGADDYMIKPFTFGELTARVRALLRRPATFTPVVITNGDYSLDTTKRILTKKGVMVPLSKHEFAVMEHLFINRQRAISKDELLAKIWGVTSKNSSNRVEACIKNIREKLTDPNPFALIQTVRGTGYTLGRGE